MLLDCLVEYLNNIESAIKDLEGAYVERYEEEILTPKRVNLRIRVRFPSGHMLEISEAILGHSDANTITHLGYRYHLQDRKNNLVFRYDNTPHYPDIPSFPHHKHLPNKVVGVEQPSVREVIEEAANISEAFKQ